MATKPSEQHGVTNFQSWYAVIVFLLLVIFGWIDRQLLALLVEPIKADLGLQDWQIGLLHGAAFAVFFALAGLPIGFLADKYSRRKILLAGSVAWSAMTAVCGLATSFWGLFLARTGVAVGEATLRPCADSMIADYFPRSRAGPAYAVYMSGIVLGIGLAFIAGALTIDVLAGAGPLHFWLIGEVALWQATFIVVGLAGLPVALLVRTIREPARTGDSAQAVSVGATRDYLKGNWPIYVAYFFSFALIATAGQANHAWGPTFLIRRFGSDVVQAGLAWGGLVVIFATLGVYCGGYAARQLGKAGHRLAFWDVALFSQILAIPVGALAFRVADAELAYVLIALCFFVQSFAAPMQPAILMSVTPARFRGQMVSLTTVAAVIFALTIGPTLVGLLNDYLFPAREDIGMSLMLVNILFPSLAVLVLWRTRRLYDRALPESQDETDPA